MEGRLSRCSDKSASKSGLSVLHVIDSLDPGRGGPSVSCPSLASAQIPECERVGILTYQLDSAVLSELALPNQGAFELFSISGGKLERVSARKARRRLCEILSGYNAVHVHGVWSPLAASACQAAYRAGVPYVVSPRGMLDPWSLSQKWLKKRVALLLLWKRILSNAHFIHALNQKEAELIGKLGLATPIRVSPNGIFRERLREMRAADGLKYERLYGKYLLFLSRLHYKKGLDYLIYGYLEYLKLGGEALLVVAGPDHGERKVFLSKVGKLGLQEKVKVIGPVYGNEKFRLLRGCRVFCLPSRQEGFSMAILEALAVSVPVVISKQCHFDEVGTAGAGAVVDLEARSIGAALLSYAESPGNAGARGAELVENEYVWEVIGPEFVKWY